MGEIQFNAARMQEVLNRLDEISNQLSQNIKAGNEALNQISANITGSEIKSVLTSYVANNNEVNAETQKCIVELTVYLAGQIAQYTANEQAGASSLSDVQKILNGLEM